MTVFVTAADGGRCTIHLKGLGGLALKFFPYSFTGSVTANT